MTSSDPIRALPAARHFGGGLLLVASRAYQLPHEPALLGALLERARGGADEEALLAALAGRWPAAAARAALATLLAIGALRRGAPPALDSFDSFAVIPQQLGTWQGKWVIADAAGNAMQRFSATLVNEIVGGAWRNHLVQHMDDGEHVEQQFVGRIVAPGVVELQSISERMREVLLLVREVAARYMLIELTARHSGALVGVETLAMERPDHRVRTMQTFTGAAELQTVLTIDERREVAVESV